MGEGIDPGFESREGEHGILSEIRGELRGDRNGSVGDRVVEGRGGHSTDGSGKVLGEDTEAGDHRLEMR